jgi:hypothetical protein
VVLTKGPSIYFLIGFEHLGRLGLGRDNTPARLERVEALEPFRPVGVPVYQDGRMLEPPELPLLNLAELHVHAAELPADLRVTLPTPLRVKSRGAFLETLELGPIVRAICWRIGALAVFHGPGRWQADYRPLVAAADAVRAEQTALHWDDWERTSTRGQRRRQMKLGGLVGSATLRAVPLSVRTALLAGSLLHVGKACVFGHGCRS